MFLMELQDKSEVIRVMNCMRAAMKCVFCCLVLTWGLWSSGCAESEQGPQTGGAPEAGSAAGDSTPKLPSEGG